MTPEEENKEMREILNYLFIDPNYGNNFTACVSKRWHRDPDDSRVREKILKYLDSEEKQPPCWPDLT